MSGPSIPPVRLVAPGEFEPERHFYPRCLNAQIHPLVRHLLSFSLDRIIKRYCHLHPGVSAEGLRAQFAYQPRWLRWAGSDLMHVTTRTGRRQMVVIETNSCPSGQKSMPLFDDLEEQGGYRVLMEHTFRRMRPARGHKAGELAVLYDKNEMESSGYAAAMADWFDEPVHLVPCFADDPDPAWRFEDGVLSVRSSRGWRPIRAAFRYVTQRPWSRIPLHTRTRILNPVLACLAGGRNKMTAAKAYEFENAALAAQGLKIHTPETIWDVEKAEIPLWVARWGGHAVVKVPYSNAGQGVYTITNQAELDAFMAEEHRYGKFIVQSLIGNFSWSSDTAAGRLYHVGTLPNRRCALYAADLRVMVSAGPQGFRPLAIYARRAARPLSDTLDGAADSWAMLGTNLSGRAEDGSWTTDTNRLLLMDRKDFNQLGLGMDDLIDALVQTVLSVVAIDKLACRLVNQKGRFRARLFRSLDDDRALLDEIRLPRSGEMK